MAKWLSSGSQPNLDLGDPVPPPLRFRQTAEGSGTKPMTACFQLHGRLDSVSANARGKWGQENIAVERLGHAGIRVNMSKIRVFHIHQENRQGGWTDTAGPTARRATKIDFDIGGANQVKPLSRQEPSVEKSTSGDRPARQAVNVIVHHCVAAQSSTTSSDFSQAVTTHVSSMRTAYVANLHVMRMPGGGNWWEPWSAQLKTMTTFPCQQAASENGEQRAGNRWEQHGRRCTRHAGVNYRNGQGNQR